MPMEAQEGEGEPDLLEMAVGADEMDFGEISSETLDAATGVWDRTMAAIQGSLLGELFEDKTQLEAVRSVALIERGLAMALAASPRFPVADMAISTDLTKLVGWATGDSGAATHAATLARHLQDGFEYHRDIANDKNRDRITRREAEQKALQQRKMMNVLIKLGTPREVKPKRVGWSIKK